MRELKELLARIQAKAYSKSELLGIKRDVEYRLQCGIGKQKAKIINQIRGHLRGV